TRPFDPIRNVGCSPWTDTSSPGSNPSSAAWLVPYACIAAYEPGETPENDPGGSSGTPTRFLAGAGAAAPSVSSVGPASSLKKWRVIRSPIASRSNGAGRWLGFGSGQTRDSSASEFTFSG